MADLIDRQALLDVMNKEGIWGYFVQNWMAQELDDIITGLPNLANDSQGLVKSWIPVTERLPDKDGEYLVTKKLRYFGNTEIDIACWFKNLMEDGNNGFYKSEQVIAWLPLPKAYKAGDTDGNS